MAWQDTFANILETGGSAAMAGAPLATGSLYGAPLAPLLLGGGALANIGGRYLRPEAPQPQDPYAQLRQQAIQGLQVPPPALDVRQLQDMLRQNFDQRIAPGIANRFSGLGAGAQRSSGFAQTLGSAAGSELNKLGTLLPQLQMQRYQAEQGRIGNLLGAIGGERQFGMQQQNLQQQRQQQQRDYIAKLLRNVGQTFGDIQRTNVQASAQELAAAAAERNRQAQMAPDLNQQYEVGV